ncbi:hypothetical protein [Sinomonas sp. RB5]
MCNDDRLAPEELRKMPYLVELAEYAHENGVEPSAVIEEAMRDTEATRKLGGGSLRSQRKAEPPP